MSSELRDIVSECEGIVPAVNEEDFSFLEDRVLKLEKDCARLYAIVAAERDTAPPMDRGMTYFPTGDAIPSHSRVDLMQGNVYMIKDVILDQKLPFRFVKNVSGRSLRRGEQYKEGVVDTQLRRDEVAPNDFFYLEI